MADEREPDAAHGIPEGALSHFRSVFGEDFALRMLKEYPKAAPARERRKQLRAQGMSNHDIDELFTQELRDE